MFNEKMKVLGKQRSAIRDLFEYGKSKKIELGDDKVYDFSIGNPSVPTPKEVSDKLKELIENIDSVSLHAYTSAEGLISSRNAIANHLNLTYNTNLLGKYIYLTIGAAAALTISFNALLNQDDEVIVFAPFFPEYKVFVEKANGKLVVVQPDKNFLPDFEDLKNKINKNTRVVVVNSPNNPTGVVYDEKTIMKIADILNEKQKEYDTVIYLLSDEPYRELIYSDIKYPFITNYYDNSIVAYSFSKSLSLPGERIGYVLLNPKMKQVDDVFACICGSARSLGFVCATSMFQHLIPSILPLTSDLSTYKENKDLLSNKLKDLGFEVINPDGAFYLFVKALCDDAKHFSDVAKQYNLLLVPSDSFGIKGYVRISYCVSKETILNSFEAFEKLKNHFKGEN